MGLKYAFFHSLIHLLLIVILYSIFNSSPLNLVTIFFGHIFIDLDHLILWKRYGIRKSFYMRAVLEFGKPRRYIFHNLYVLSIFMISIFLILSPKSFILGLFALSTVMHLAWDLFEDVVIFKIGLEHWKL